MVTAVDTNIFLDVFLDDPQFREKSFAALSNACSYPHAPQRASPSRFACAIDADNLKGDGSRLPAHRGMSPSPCCHPVNQWHEAIASNAFIIRFLRTSGSDSI